MNPFNAKSVPLGAQRCCQGRSVVGGASAWGGAAVVAAANPLGGCKGEAVRVAVQRRQFKALYPGLPDWARFPAQSGIPSYSCAICVIWPNLATLYRTLGPALPKHEGWISF